MVEYFTSQKLIRCLPLLSAALVLSACAMNPADAQSSTPQRIADVHRTCATTMGLNPANADYDMCVTSLLQTLAGMDQASLVERDRRACLQRGLQPNTREFALCVVDAKQLASN